VARERNRIALPGWPAPARRWRIEAIVEDQALAEVLRASAKASMSGTGARITCR
jgi:hypothetical protein